MTVRRVFYLFAASFLSCPSAHALDLVLPAGAEVTVERLSAYETFQAPVGPFDGAAVPKLDIEGRLMQRAWRMAGRDLTPLQIMAPLREQLEEQDFHIALDCSADDCGGFDFRFNIDVLPGPNMFVDLSQFRYLTAFRGDPEDPQEAVGILTSSTRGAAYLQIFQARAAPVPVPKIDLSEPVGPGPFFEEAIVSAEDSDLSSDLLSSGRTVLRGLDFASGSFNLGSGPHLSLEALADFLSDNPELRVALVGHTDTVGSLQRNIALSRARAASVRAVLIDSYGVRADRIDAEGMGYLAPIASNLTEEGRERNRRVEAILLTD